MDETSPKKVSKEVDYSKYIQVFDKHLQTFPEIDSLKRVLLSYKLGTKYKIQKRKKDYIRLREELGLLTDSISSDEIFFSILDEYFVRKKKKSKRNDYRILQEIFLKELKDTLAITSKVQHIDSLFDLTESYYNPSEEAEKGILKIVRENIKADSLAEEVYRALKRRYFVTNLNSSSFTLVNGSLIEKLELDTINPSFLEDLVIRFEHKMKRAEKLGSEKFMKEVLNQIPKVLFLLLPIFAFIFKLLYIRNKIFYINHLIFSLHVHSIFFIYLFFAIEFPVWYIILPCIIGIFLHLYLSMKKVYQQGHLKTILKMLMALFLYFWVLVFGLIVLLILSVITI